MRAQQFPDYIMSPRAGRCRQCCGRLGASALDQRRTWAPGKTSLAYAVAKKFDMELLTWQVKSTTKAQDGLYVYDTVQRLNDSRFGDGDVSDINRYIKFGPLGKAFRSDRRVVLLIDEVDKADVEFPNDLLHELDQMDFVVNETRRVG